MSLVNLKSNLANYRAPFTTPSVESQTVKKLGTTSAPRTSTKPTDSKLDIDSTLTKFSKQEIYTPSAFVNSIVVNKSKLNIDYLPKKFSVSGMYTPTNLFPESNIKKTTTRWSGLTPPVVNYFDNVKSGAKGFTIRFTDPNQSNFLGISGTTYTYPNTVRVNRLMKPSKDTVAFPGPQNFLDDKFAAGFTNDFWNAKKGLAKKETQFKNLNYIDTVSVPTPLNSSKGPGGGWILGDTSFKAQLGNGSTKLVKDYERGIVYNWYTPGIIFDKGKETPHTGFHDNNKYVTKGAVNKGYLAATYNTHSPIDDVYKKFNLQDEAYNPTYMKQPFIVRGIQRKGITDPEHWGSGFDDGLIQGGISAMLDRSSADTTRIAKFMASPKGLLWIVKQVGLGLTNPKVETVIGARLSRVHLGIPTLLSVAGNGLGLHFPSHGVGIGTDIANYESVQIANQLRYDDAGPTSNRLIGLQDALLEPSSLITTDINKFKTEVKNAIKISKGQKINLLSGMGGPQSVYGIGNTDIKRYVDTVTPGTVYANKQFHALNPNDQSANSKYPVYNRLNQYSPSKAVLHSTAAAATETVKSDPKLVWTSDSEYDLDPIQKADLSSNTTKEKEYGKSTTVNNYITLAYGKIPKDKKSFRDFRNDIDATTKLTPSQTGILGTGLDDTYYQKNNLETKYGFSKLADTSKIPPRGKGSIITPNGKPVNGRFDLINEGTFRGDKVNAIDIGYVGDTKNLDDVYNKNNRDLISFWFEDGSAGKNVMPFRCTITGLSDTFSPSWDKIDIMGRPEGAYLYTSFERSISFNFKVAAMSRSEMIPLWRKLNYLASYTMPDYNTNRAVGPFMRITIGDMFKNTPGFINSLTYTIDDEASWDIADDYSTENTNPKQLPMTIDVAVTYTVISDYRPQFKGTVYDLTENSDWLTDRNK
jgi:hypothetical protein